MKKRRIVKMEEYFEDYTPERWEEIRKDMRIKRDKYFEQLTVDYLLGRYVGEYVISNILPTLSISGIRTKKCISVTEEEANKYEELNDFWYKNHKKTNEPTKEVDVNWVAMINYYNSLKVKYLPAELVCHVPLLKFNDIEEFKKGFRNSLWNSDTCEYQISKNEDIVIEDGNDTDYFTLIKLKLS